MRRAPESRSWGWDLGPHLQAHCVEGQAEAWEGGGQVCVTSHRHCLPPEAFSCGGGGPANEGRACHVGLTAGEGGGQTMWA